MGISLGAIMAVMFSYSQPGPLPVQNRFPNHALTVRQRLEVDHACLIFLWNGQPVVIGDLGNGVTDLGKIVE